jgi:hypothetical protein
MGRPPLKKSGAMSPTERLRRHRKKVAREKKLANPWLKAKQERRAERERELAGKILALPNRRCGVIYADPEWRFEPYSRETGLGRSADNHYPTSGIATITARDVASIAAPDCVLFMWAIAPMFPEALAVLAAWGFAYRTHAVWLRQDRSRLLGARQARASVDRDARQDPGASARDAMGVRHRSSDRQALGQAGTPRRHNREALPERAEDRAVSTRTGATGVGCLGAEVEG